MLRLDGQVAVVTGAGNGLGKAHAKLLAARGCRVVVNDLGVHSTGQSGAGDSAQDVVDEIVAAGGTAVVDRHNVATEAEAIVTTAVDAFGQLDIVVNNAGVINDRPFGDSNAEDWHRLGAVHLRGTVEVCRAAWPHLVRSSAARIVNTSSIALLGGPSATAYGAAKGGIFAFSKNLAQDARPLGINVNVILPTAWTRMTASLGDPNVVDVVRRRLLPENVSAFLLWLVHPETDIWGEAFRVSGQGASRVVVATYPSVLVDSVTPESWRQAQSKLMEEAPLVAINNTLEAFERDLREAQPDVDLSETYATGGNSIRAGQGDAEFAN